MCNEAGGGLVVWVSLVVGEGLQVGLWALDTGGVVHVCVYMCDVMCRDVATWVESSAVSARLLLLLAAATRCTAMYWLDS